MAEVFDTHNAYQQLREGDCFSDNQAEVLVRIGNGAITGRVATKAALDVLKSDLASSFALLEYKLDNSMKILKSEMRENLANFRSNIITWVVTSQITITTLLFVALKYFGT